MSLRPRGTPVPPPVLLGPSNRPSSRASPRGSRRTVRPMPVTQQPAPLSDTDLAHLRRCVELAREALAAGDEPFGSVLVTADGRVVAEDRNRETSLADPTRHPELELARLASQELTADERASATVYTSGEHCPMCAAAHGWARIGRIVYAVSTEQYVAWLREWGVGPAPVAPLPVQAVAPGVVVQGPAPELADEVRELHRQLQDRRAAGR
jgi:tRNA(Arg) A34 adenosine deaminase TadA